MDRDMETEIKVLEEQIKEAQEKIRRLKTHGCYFGQWVQLSRSQKSNKWRLGFCVPDELRYKSSGQKTLKLFSRENKEEILEIIPEIISDLQMIMME